MFQNSNNKHKNASTKKKESKFVVGGIDKPKININHRVAVLFVAATCVFVLAVSVLIFIKRGSLVNHNSSTSSDLDTEQVIQQKKQQLLTNRVSSNASPQEKTAYYNELLQSLHSANDTDKTVEVYYKNIKPAGIDIGTEQRNWLARCLLSKGHTQDAKVVLQRIIDELRVSLAKETDAKTKNEIQFRIDSINAQVANL